MRFSNLLAALSGLALAVSATAAMADTTLATDNGVIRDSLCVGAACLNSGSYWGSGNEIEIMAINTRLRFEDTSGSSYPDTDWALQANETSAIGAEQFMLQDLTAGTTPLAVSGGASSNSLFVATDGKIGLGTSLPQANLHIIDATGEASLRLEETAATPYVWDIRGNPVGLYVRDPQVSSLPFVIGSGAPSYSLVVKGTGAIGLGVYSPQAALHLQRSDGTAQMLIEEASATANPRTPLNLQNNGRPEIAMGNTATNGEWSFGAGTNFILKQGAVGTASSAKTKLFEVKSSGNATLTGSLTTGGTTCGAGCDAVFAPDHAVPGIEAHARAMFALGYLPNVGPTPEGAPVDVTDKLGRMLNELETAHIFIARQQAQMARMQAEIDALKAARG